ncbi:hypothetical protein QC762_700885 [Podospora pseudocomata]|uniref:Uncharacterized protein n=1 Tax=Podospora pseudocomata TaxID=2093779 RepID=A0ABR0G5H2_9PEZI|nr:hypothetical protein QC762_700885 [Podospora pseudocomata]
MFGPRKQIVDHLGGEIQGHGQLGINAALLTWKPMKYKTYTLSLVSLLGLFATLTTAQDSPDKGVTATPTNTGFQASVSGGVSFDINGKNKTFGFNEVFGDDDSDSDDEDDQSKSGASEMIVRSSGLLVAGVIVGAGAIIL